MREDLNNGSEDGVEFRLNPDDTYTPFLMPVGSNGIQFPPVSTNNPLIRMHKHHSNLDPIFSAEDIVSMVGFFLGKQNIDPESPQNTNITSIMVSTTGVHAFRISNPSDLQDFYNQYQGNQGNFDAFITVYKNRVIIESNKQCGGTCSDAEYNQLLLNNFIAFMNTFVWGIEFYFAPHPTTADGDYTWKKK